MMFFIGIDVEDSGQCPKTMLAKRLALALNDLFDLRNDPWVLKGRSILCDLLTFDKASENSAHNLA